MAFLQRQEIVLKTMAMTSEKPCLQVFHQHIISPKAQGQFILMRATQHPYTRNDVTMEEGPR